MTRTCEQCHEPIQIATRHQKFCEPCRKLRASRANCDKVRSTTLPPTGGVIRAKTPEPRRQTTITITRSDLMSERGPEQLEAMLQRVLAGRTMLVG